MRKNEGQIAIYSRKSKFTGKGESISNQIELCRDYIRNLYGEDALHQIVVYEDEGFSGGNLKRPAFQRMMEEARKHQFEAIVVYRLDRISRNIGDFASLIDELNKLNVAFVSIREQFDTSSPMGRAMMFIISVFSQLERETIAERIRDNMRELAKTGRWLGGNTPTGFTSESISSVTVDGKIRKACQLKPIPEETEMVKLIFDLYIQADSLTAVETELLRRRIKSKTGRNHTRFSIKTILQNPVYMTADEDTYRYFAERGVEVYSDRSAFDGQYGIMAYNRTEQEKGKSTIYLPMDEWIIAVGRHPGIIPSKQWIKVQESLERNKSKGYRKPRSNEALLTGLLFCSCGDRMYPKRTQRKNAEGETVFSYMCKMKEKSRGERCHCRNVSGNQLDSAVIEQIKLLTEDGSLFAEQMEKSRDYFTGSRAQFEAQLAELKMEFTENEKKIEGLVDSIGILGESSARMPVLKRIEALSDSNRELEKRIQELEELTLANELSDMEFDILRQLLSVFRDTVDTMTVEEKRAAIRTVVRKVIWNGHNVNLVLIGADEGEIEYNDLVLPKNKGEDCLLETEKFRLGEDSK